jgi:hypothetical protein
MRTFEKKRLVLLFVETFDIDNLRITLDREGARFYSKVSYPLRYGRFSEIKTPNYIFQFNLNGELKFINGRGKGWPDPSEWLKRTITDDWIYYSTGGYKGVYDCFGEYYVPCLSYPSNNINSCDPFNDNAVISAIEAWGQLHEKLTELNSVCLPRRIREFLDLAVLNSPTELRKKSGRIYEIIGDNITVLPPDTRHVDYDVIPIIIADGCLYRCGFCKVKSHHNFKERSKENIKTQVIGLKRFFSKDISNYNSVFLGQHDALHSSTGLMEFAATHAFEALNLNNSNLEDPSLFIFGSVNSIIESDYGVFERIGRLPFKTYINIGLESADQETLHKLGKGITKDAVETAFAKVVDINRRYEQIEITSNFVFGPDLPDGHINSFLRLIERNFDHPFHKGSIYFSPLINAKNIGWKSNIKREFYKLKIRIPVPSFLYLIQRL